MNPIKMVGMKIDECSWMCRIQQEFVFVFEQDVKERNVCPHCVAAYLTAFDAEVRLGLAMLPQIVV